VDYLAGLCGLPIATVGGQPLPLIIVQAPTAVRSPWYGRHPVRVADYPHGLHPPGLCAVMTCV
jgi:hypothetical protein